MPTPHVEADGLSIVALGTFNPGIVQPAWLAKYGLLSSTEAEAAAEVDVSQVEIAGQYGVGRVTLSWAVLDVVMNRMQVTSTTETPAYSMLRDLFVGVLGLLPDTPVQRLGLNHWSHVQMPDAESWDAVGVKLVPRENWTAVLEKPGMLAANVQGVRTDGHQGGVNVSVQPSAQLQLGVYVSLNDDILLDEGANAADAAGVIGDEWDASAERFQRIRDHLLGNL